MLDTLKIEDMVHQEYPVKLNKAGAEIPLRQQAKKNLAKLRHMMAKTKDDIPMEKILQNIVKDIIPNETLPRQKMNHRIQKALIVSYKQPDELMSWVRKNAFNAPLDKQKKFFSKLVRAAFIKHPRLVKKNLETALEVTQNVKQKNDQGVSYATRKLIKIATDVRPRFSLSYARKIEIAFDESLIKARFYKALLKKRPHLLNPEEKLSLARDYKVKVNMKINNKDTFRKKMSTDVLEYLQNMPVEQRLQMISMMKRTEPVPVQDDMIKGALLVSLLAENKGLETYATLIPPARKLLAQWKDKDSEDQQAVRSQLKFFVGDSKEHIGQQLKLDF